MQLQSLLEYVTVPLLSLLVSLLVVAAWVAVWLLRRWLKQQQLSGWVAVAVQAAEQLFDEPGSGKDKFGYAMSLLRELFPNLDPKLIESLIEAAVLQLSSGEERPAPAAASRVAPTQLRSGPRRPVASPKNQYGFPDG